MPAFPDAVAAFRMGQRAALTQRSPLANAKIVNHGFRPVSNREHHLMRFWLGNPFAIDLMACKETNS